jgi:hypothetical protein
MAQIFVTQARWHSHVTWQLNFSGMVSFKFKSETRLNCKLGWANLKTINEQRVLGGWSAAM